MNQKLTFPYNEQKKPMETAIQRVIGRDLKENETLYEAFTGRMTFPFKQSEHKKAVNTQ